MFKPTCVLRKTCSRNQENSFISNKKFIQVIARKIGSQDEPGEDLDYLQVTQSLYTPPTQRAA
jgi:hypothetical protein